MRIEWRSKARDDLRSIVDFIDIDNPDAATAVFERIRDQITAPIDHPRMGRPGRVSRTRELVIRRTPFVVAYRVTGEVVSILRVMHGARKWPAALP